MARSDICFYNSGSDEEITLKLILGLKKNKTSIDLVPVRFWILKRTPIKMDLRDRGA